MAFDDDTRVEFSLEATVNTGNFNNPKPGYKVSTNVRPGEHPNQTRERLQALVLPWIEEDMKAARSE